MSNKSMHDNTFPLLTIRDLCSYLLLIHFLLIKLGCEFCIALTFDILKSGKVVTERIFLLAQCVTEMSSQRDERDPHGFVGDDLMMMRLEQEEDDTGCEDKVPFLYNPSVDASSK